MSFLKLIEEIRSPFLDQIFQFVTYFGQELIVLAVICLLYWCIDKKFAYMLGFTYFTAGLFVQALKITFRIPRPWVLDPSFHAVESAVPGATGYSFPSGHTMGGTCLFAPIALHTKKAWVKILCVFAFLAIGFSRLYLGVHTPKDVLTSMAISLIISWLIWKYGAFLVTGTKYLKQIAFVLAFVSIAVSIYALVLLSNGTIDAHYAADCCKAAGAGVGFALGWYIERTYINFKTTTGTKHGQVIKLLVGLGITLLLKEGMGMLFPSAIPMKMLQYFLLVLWVLVGYPLCFIKLQKK